MVRWSSLFQRALMVAVSSAVLSGGAAIAQTVANTPLGRPDLIRLESATTWTPARTIQGRASHPPLRLARADVESMGSLVPRDVSASLQRSSGERSKSVGRRILGGALGGVGGFFAGGYIGAAIDGDCGGCDDPGLKGALIGAPVGAVVGAILGAKFF